MKLNWNCVTILLLVCCTTLVTAQVTVTESGLRAPDQQYREIPRDSPYEQEYFANNKPLPYEHIREADVFWEKRIWRVIDTREKMNLGFRIPNDHFVSKLIDAALDEEITLYSPIDDKFTHPMSIEELNQRIFKVDTIMIHDFDTGTDKYKIVHHDFNPEDVKRFRVKEVWLFDEETSTMHVRILGIAPLIEEYDDNGNLKFEIPLFWVYYPHCRDMLATKKAYNPLNDASLLSWEDIFEMRYFSSMIVKESNILNNRIQDYKSGVDMVVEAERIKEEIRNFEENLWTN